MLTSTGDRTWEYLNRLGMRHTLHKGDRVKVNGGGFSDIDAVFYNPCGAERVKILLTVLGRETEVSVPLQYIARAAE